jgi:hypothetical protein
VKFRWLANENALATEKNAGDIGLFHAGARKPAQFVAAKLDSPVRKTYCFSPSAGGRSSMVEPQIVVLDVAGSSPVDHPISSFSARLPPSG